MQACSTSSVHIVWHDAVAYSKLKDSSAEMEYVYVNIMHLYIIIYQCDMHLLQ